jgi:hypothetical protein
VGGAEGRLATGGGGGGGVGEGASSGHASWGADPPTTVRPYREPADAAGFELEAPNTGRVVAEGAGGFAAGVGAFLNAFISTFPTGV